MGGIMAAAILPTANTQHGHGETMFHSPDGIFSVDLNVYPRSDWESKQLTKHAILGAGACGPYALCADNGDQIFRSKFGIQTLRSAAAQPQNLGNPLRPISWPVHSWTDGDHQPYLRFCSLDKWAVGSRIFCTTGMRVSGNFWYSRGILSQNLNPVGQSSEPPAWEGLWTFPKNIPSPVLLLSGDFAGKERCLAFFYDDDRNIRLAEFDQSLDMDQDQCGYKHEISSQIITAEIAAGDVFTAKEITLGTLVFRKLRRSVDFGVWLRGGHDDEWTPWRSGTVTVDREKADNLGDVLRRTRDREHRIGLGELPAELKSSRKLQALIRWRGFAQIEGIKFSAAKADPSEGRDDESSFLSTKFDGGQYSDYEYTDGSPWAQST